MAPFLHTTFLAFLLSGGSYNNCLRRSFTTVRCTSRLRSPLGTTSSLSSSATTRPNSGSTDGKQVNTLFQVHLHVRTSQLTSIVDLEQVVQYFRLENPFPLSREQIKNTLPKFSVATTELNDIKNEGILMPSSSSTDDNSGWNLCLTDIKSIVADLGKALNGENFDADRDLSIKGRVVTGSISPRDYSLEKEKRPFVVYLILIMNPEKRKHQQNIENPETKAMHAQVNIILDTDA